MRMAGGGGGGGHFVGVDPAAAQGLIGAMSAAAGRAMITSWRIAALLVQAGTDAAGAETPAALGRLQGWLGESATDLRWRMVLLADAGGRSGGMVTGILPFASAAEARRAGERHAEAMADALHRAVSEDGDEAMAEYLRLLRATAAYSDDPAWAGGLVNTLGSDGIYEAVWFAQGEVEGDIPATHQIIAPIATALATAMRAGTAAPTIQTELLAWPSHRLGVLLTAAAPETNFLVAAVRSRFVDAAWNDDPFDDLREDEAALFLDALSGDAEASYRVLTSRGPADERAAIDILRTLPMFDTGDAHRFAALALEQGLVAYPATGGVRVWNTATDTTADVVGFMSQMGWATDDMDPALSNSMLRLLHPHLDAVAGIGIESSSISTDGYDVSVALPDGRRTLDVPAEELRDFLGGVLQHDETVAQMQALLAAYAQSDGVQANRIPLIDADGRVADLKPFMADSMRIAGLMGITGQGLDVAGHDEESRTRILTGALGFASKKGIGRVIGWTGPLGFAAKETAGRGAAWATGEFRDWVATFEPIEGEEGVDAFLQTYADNTEASLREQMANDPEVAALPAAQQEEMLAHARRIAQDMVKANLLEVYADLTGETAKESQ